MEGIQDMMHDVKTDKYECWNSYVDAELWNLEYTVEQTRAVRALSFGLLPWLYGSGGFAEKIVTRASQSYEQIINLLVDLLARK